MFTLVKKNGDRIPLEDWIIVLWVSGKLQDPLMVNLFRDAKQLTGDWKSLRKLQLSKREPLDPDNHLFIS